jgi:lysophospholipase L1-like esterase
VIRILFAVVALAVSVSSDGQPASPPHAAVTAVDRADPGWQARHESMDARIRQGVKEGDIGLLFIGDSITHGWESEGREAWTEYYEKRAAVNLGIGGDRTQHVLWRLDAYDLEGLRKPSSGSAPRAAVIMIGTNNSNGNDHTAEEIADGIKAIVARLRADLPDTRILLLAIFPRGETPNAQREKNAKASELASRAADGKTVHYVDIGAKFLEPDGTLSREIMPDALHLSPRGYRIWAEAIEPKIKELMGE